VRRESLGEFLVTTLPRLEEYEIDLALAPLFTPTLADQAALSEALGSRSITTEQWPELIRRLLDRPTVAQLVTDDGHVQHVALQELTIERFVHRLRLDGCIPEALFRLLDDFQPLADRPLLTAIARRKVWESEARRSIFQRYLTSAVGQYQLADAMELLKLVEIYQPANLGELIAHIPHWRRVLQEEVNAGAGGKPFFNERVEELHGGGRDQRRQDNARLTVKEGELAFLDRLQVILGAKQPEL